MEAQYSLFYLWFELCNFNLHKWLLVCIVTMFYVGIALYGRTGIMMWVMVHTSLVSVLFVTLLIDLLYQG